MINEKKFRLLGAVQSLVLLLIPYVLWFVEGERLKSISAYANFSPMVFAFLLTLAGALFIYGGVAYKRLRQDIYVGIALFGVVLFNHLTFPVIHYMFAGLFFLGYLFNTIYFSSNRERIYKIIGSSIVILGMAGTFIFHWYSIFWGETIGIMYIGIHHFLEIENKID